MRFVAPSLFRALNVWICRDFIEGGITNLYVLKPLKELLKMFKIGMFVKLNNNNY